jgi:hypothetical protein
MPVPYGGPVSVSGPPPGTCSRRAVCALHRAIALLWPDAAARVRTEPDGGERCYVFLASKLIFMLPHVRVGRRASATRWTTAGLCRTTGRRACTGRRGPLPESGPVPDLGPVSDGELVPDGGPVQEGRPMPDGGPVSGGGPVLDGGPLPDYGPVPDGGVSRPTPVKIFFAYGFKKISSA